MGGEQSLDGLLSKILGSPQVDTAASRRLQFGPPPMQHPQFGQPAFQEPQFGHSSMQHPQFGHPAMQHPQFGQPSMESPQFEQPPMQDPMEDLWMIGGVFLERFVTVFDFEEGRIGFAEPSGGVISLSTSRLDEEPEARRDFLTRAGYPVHANTASVAT